jgi:glycerol uptake facilitator-like aquaporin
MDNALIVEFVGTTLLISSFAFTHSPIMVVAGFAVAVALGHKVSGANFNPAMTAWSLLMGRIGKQKALSYMLAQFAAAVFVFMLSSVISV